MAIRPRGFTVIEVIEALGYQPTPKLDWRVGKLVQRAYTAAYGRPPDKPLRYKTNLSSNGQHCIATYPMEFKATAVSIIRKEAEEQNAAALAQQWLFSHDD